MASASGTSVPAIARLIAADSDTVRDVIHAFNDRGLAMLAPRWGPGRPRRIADAEIAVVVATAQTRPARLGLPFTHWSIRKLTAYLDGDYGRQDPAWVPTHPIRIGRERVRRILHEHDISFQRTRTTYHRTHGIRYFHGCYSLSDDTLWGVLHEHKSGAHTLAAFKTIRAARPDGGPIYIICDNLSAKHHSGDPRPGRHPQGRVVPDPTSASWANPIEAQFGPLRMFTMAHSNYPSHVTLARAMHAYLRWRNANNRHPDVIAAPRRERARSRSRSERQQRWGRPAPARAA